MSIVRRRVYRAILCKRSTRYLHGSEYYRSGGRRGEVWPIRNSSRSIALLRFPCLATLRRKCNGFFANAIARRGLGRRVNDLPHRYFPSEASKSGAAVRVPFANDVLHRGICRLATMAINRAIAVNCPLRVV